MRCIRRIHAAGAALILAFAIPLVVIARGPAHSRPAAMSPRAEKAFPYTLADAEELLRQHGFKAMRTVTLPIKALRVSPAPVEAATYASPKGDNFDLLSYRSADEAARGMASVRKAARSAMGGPQVMRAKNLLAVIRHDSFAPSIHLFVGRLSR